MDGLDNRQIILLTLFVSFVTSIATGIVTVSLLEQAPPGITQIINRVVEKTVETVSPETKVVEVVKEVPGDTVEDKITRVIEKRSPAMVAVITKNETAELSSEKSGFFVSSDGTVLTSGKTSDTVIYEIVYGDNIRAQAEVEVQSESGNILVLKIVKNSDVGALEAIKQAIDGDEFNYVPLVESAPTLGQNIVSISRNSLGIAIRNGLISSISSEVEGPKTIETDLRSSEKFIGSPVFSLSGGFLGMIVEYGQFGTNVLAASSISDFISAHSELSVGKVEDQTASTNSAR